MSYKGIYKPSNPKKYKGDQHNIIYRSLWERNFMVYCDENNDIVEWGSEELIVPYISPLDNKQHRYFPDFYIKTKNGEKFKLKLHRFYNHRDKGACPLCNCWLHPRLYISRRH